MKIAAYAARSAGAPITPFAVERREVGPSDVLIEVLFCGICHSDVHQARDEWGGAIFPMVPGHEIVGRVTRVGAQVTQGEGGRSRRRRLHGRLVRHVQLVRRGPRAVLRERLRVHVQLHGDGSEDADVRRLLHARGRTRSLRAPRAGELSIRRAPRRSSARASPRTRRCGSSAARRATASPSSASAAWDTWR